MVRDARGAIFNPGPRSANCQISKVGAQFMQPGAGPGRGRNIEIRGAALATGGPQGLDFLTMLAKEAGPAK